MRQDTYEKMGKPEILSIQKLANDTRYLMGLIRGATYLPIRLEDYSDSQHVTIISSASPITSIIQMVNLGRVDWAADYPHLVQWGTTSGDLSVNEAFAMVDIEEFRGEEVQRSGIACTKNDWGKNIIDRLNVVVNEEIILANLKWISLWMPPGAVKEEFFNLNLDGAVLPQDGHFESAED